MTYFFEKVVLILIVPSTINKCSYLCSFCSSITLNCTDRITWRIKKIPPLLGGNIGGDFKKKYKLIDCFYRSLHSIYQGIPGLLGVLYQIVK